MRQQITVSLDSDTGPVFHGASGALYGLSDDGVPGADLRRWRSHSGTAATAAAMSGC